MRNHWALSVLLCAGSVPAVAQNCPSSECCCATMGGNGGYACRDTQFCTEITAGGQCYADSNCGGNDDFEICQVSMLPIPNQNDLHQYLLARVHSEDTPATSTMWDAER